MTGAIRKVVLPVLLALGLAASAAMADDAEKEALYSRYHQAIEAAKQCRGLDFDQDAHGAMAQVIAARIQHGIGAKRLSLLTKAQSDARALVDKEGCEGAKVMELLALFDAELAPALN